MDAWDAPEHRISLLPTGLNLELVYLFQCFFFDSNHTFDHADSACTQGARVSVVDMSRSV